MGATLEAVTVASFVLVLGVVVAFTTVWFLVRKGESK